MPPVSDSQRAEIDEDRIEILREATVMAFYVSIVLLATLAALPSGETSGDGHVEGGVHGIALIGLIWGTTIGLALAHWFAFRLTSSAYGGGHASMKDIRIGIAQIAGAMSVAVLCTIPVLLVGDANDVPVTTFVPALIIGSAGFTVAHASGRTRFQSLILGGVVMLLGVTVAALKNFLVGH
jgi:fumarate reductase subunit C